MSLILLGPISNIQVQKAHSSGSPFYLPKFFLYFDPTTQCFIKYCSKSVWCFPHNSNLGSYVQNTNTSLFTLWLHQWTVPSSAQHPFASFMPSPNLTCTQVSRNKILANLHFIPFETVIICSKSLSSSSRVNTRVSLQNQLHTYTKDLFCKNGFLTLSRIIT